MSVKWRTAGRGGERSLSSKSGGVRDVKQKFVALGLSVWEV